MVDTIKLTNREVLVSTGALASMSSLKLPAKVAYAIAKAVNKLSGIETTIGDVQKKIWDRYGEKGADGKLVVNREAGTITIQPGQVDACNKDYADLMAESNEISGLRQITIDELGDVKIEPSIFARLEWLIKDE